MGRMNQMMNLNIIKEFEGLRLNAYLCPAGVWTIGYGNTFHPNGAAVRRGDTLSGEAEAEKLLEQVVSQDFLPHLERIPNWSQLNENQKAAVLSFAFNLGARFYGADGFRSITGLLSNPSQWNNRGEVQRVFSLYVKAGGATLPGLVRRRKAEADKFLAPVTTQTTTPKAMTPMTPIERRFTYHPPQSEERKAKHEKVNAAAIAFATALDEVVTDKQALEHILSQVQFARMLANQTITMEEIG